ncbi:MAG: tRNA lysidine(34) synthetase TilS [Acidobacteria bacterium]|nr:tRNA lysidine(34) synthetase TilS [Acidobacteriota bacterium]
MLRRQDQKPVRLSGFARRLLAEWKRLEWPVSGGRYVVAVSGGADSVALLLALDELVRASRVEAELSVAHLDHGLRGACGEADARWVEELARTLGYECLSGRASVGERARVGRDNLEQSARRARYEFLGEAARGCGAGAVLTAHTLDDQAETVLLCLLRGSGAEGLGGIRPVRALDAAGDVLLLRPLLGWARRADTEGFCRERGVGFRTDEMNADERFARVRVRRKVLPLLETFNPRAVEALARAAELLREDAATLETLASKLLDEASAGATATAGVEASVVTGEKATAVENAGSASSLSVEALAGAPASLRRRALRQWLARGRGDLRRLEMSHLLALEKLLKGTRGGRVAELPGGCAVERRRGRLYFRRKKS